jgi:hypothetical protein
MATPRPSALGRGVRLVPLAAVAALVVLLFVLPGVTLASVSTPSTTAQPAQGSGISATVTWNGANVLNYSSPTSAVHIGFNGVVNVHYTWSSPLLAGGAPTINDARLQIFYFGFALATRDVVNSVATPATSGQFTMNWSTGALQYILEGSYKLVASLLASNGTTMWSQSFWAFVAAPFYIGALLPIVLILIVIWEVYNLATVGRQVLLGKRPPSGSPETAAAAAPSAPAAGSESTEASPTDSSPPGDSSPPPSGGAS